MAIPSTVDFKQFQDRKMSLEKPTDNFTMVPNAFLDEQLNKIEYVSELKITLAVIRKTIGFGKQHDIISLSQFEKLTGLGHASVVDGLKYALDRGLVTRLKQGQYWVYSIQVVSLGYPLDESSSPGIPEVVASGDTQKKDLNKKLTKDKSLGELHSQAATASNILEFISTDSPPDKASQSTFSGEHIPVDLKSKRASREKTQPQSEKKARAAPSWQDLPQFVIWRKYADIKGYRPWPNPQQRELIIKHIPSDPENLERWEGLIVLWLDRKRNYKIFNIDGLVDVFVNGWREKPNSRKGQYQ
jgi:hypothetical protein